MASLVEPIAAFNRHSTELTQVKLWGRAAGVRCASQAGPQPEAFCPSELEVRAAWLPPPPLPPPAGLGLGLAVPLGGGHLPHVAAQWLPASIKAAWHLPNSFCCWHVKRSSGGSSVHAGVDGAGLAGEGLGPAAAAAGEGGETKGASAAGSGEAVVGAPASGTGGLTPPSGNGAAADNAAPGNVGSSGTGTGPPAVPSAGGTAGVGATAGATGPAASGSGARGGASGEGACELVAGDPLAGAGYPPASLVGAGAGNVARWRSGRLTNVAAVVGWPPTTRGPKGAPPDWAAVGAPADGVAAAAPGREGAASVTLTSAAGAGTVLTSTAGPGTAAPGAATATATAGSATVVLQRPQETSHTPCIQGSPHLPHCIQGAAQHDGGVRMQAARDMLWARWQRCRRD